MKSFIRIKKISGHEYVYEITPYYDPKTKTIRQKSKYIGAYENGKIKPKRNKIPRCVYDFGEFMPIMKIIDDLKIREILASHLSEKQTNILLTLAINRIVNPVSAHNIRSWYEGTYLWKVFGDLPISSQNLSDFMAKIGDSTIARDFSADFIQLIDNGEPLLYDINTLSSSSRLMDILEYGYNRDGDKLPQLNISIVAHKDLGIPLTFDVYPGSIVDVSTLRNTIERLSSIGLNNPTLIMDRGFFSETNLLDLIGSEYNFIIPASFTNRTVKSLVLKSRRNIENPEWLHKFNGNMIFVQPVQLEISSEERQDIVDGYLFFDLKREKEDKSLFYQRLYDTKEKLRGRTLRKYERASRVFEDIAGPFAKYYKWKVKDGHFEVKLRNKAITQCVNRMGFSVVLYHGDFGWDDVLSWCKERDIIEKMFRRLKNDLEARPMRAQRTEVARGWIFVNFLGLIIRCRLSRMIIASGLVKKYSIPSLLMDLRRLKMVELSDGSLIKTEVTKKQRLIFEGLGIDPNSCA